MDNLFLLLFLVFLIALIVGLIKPTIFSLFIKGNLTRKKIGLIFGIATFIFFVLFGATTDSSKTKQTATRNQPTEQKIEVSKQEKTSKNTQAVKEVKTPKYQVVYEASNKRYDGGNSFYVLIDSIDLSNDQFKEGIKELVKKLAKEKGGKNSFEIHDNRKSLDVSYKQYGDMSLGRPRTEEENQIQAIHFVAIFSGQLETNIYKNTLSFFPGAFTGYSKVGKYVKTIEFDPSK